MTLKSRLDRLEREPAPPGPAGESVLDRIERYAREWEADPTLIPPALQTFKLAFESAVARALIAPRPSEAEQRELASQAEALERPQQKPAAPRLWPVIHRGHLP